MQIKALKVFCDVVQQRSFSRAADENDMSQSGASQLVQQLEDSLGVRLIDRSKRPFVLTPEGEVYYAGCRDLLSRYFALEDRVMSMHQEVVGRVRVASIYSVGLHLMNSYITDFLKVFPKANVRLEYLHPHLVYQSVENDVADLGLVSYPKGSRTIEAIPWREEPMALVCAPQHPLAKREAVALEELHGCRMVSFDTDLQIRREIDRALNQHHVEVIVEMDFDNIETIKRAVEIDAGVSLLPLPTVKREVAAGSLCAVPLTTDELIRPLGILVRRGRQLSGTAQRFIDLLRGETTAFAGANDETLGGDFQASRSAATAAGETDRNGHAVAGEHEPETRRGPASGTTVHRSAIAERRASATKTPAKDAAGRAAENGRTTRS